MVGPGQTYTTIQAGINHANAGDTVNVLSGTYNENVVVNKSITLAGTGLPVIDGKGGSSAVKITAIGVVFQGFNVRNAQLCIDMLSNNCTVTGNIVSGGTVYSILLDNSHYCQVSANTISYSLGGIDAYSTSGYNNISSNTIFNITYSGIGISSSNTVVYKNTVYYCLAGVDLENTNNTVIGNTFVNNSNAGAFIDASNCILEDNIFNDDTYYGVTIDTGITGIQLENNTLNGNQYGIRAQLAPNNSMVNNTANHNKYYGIYSYNCNNCTLAGNTADYNGDSGIYLNSGSGCSLVGNIAENNVNSGIVLYSSINNTFSDNLVTGSLNGFYGVGGNFNNFTNNTATGNSMFGYRLDSTINNIIANGAISFNNIGIRAGNDTSVINNSIIGNTNEGIYVYMASGVNASDNLVQGNGIGIHVYKSDNNAVYNNTVTVSTDKGISVDQSYNNNIIDNVINNSTNDGLYAFHGDYNGFTGNSINGNNNGVNLEFSTNNYVANNTIHANTNDGIFLHAYSNNNRVTGNTVDGSADSGINLDFLCGDNVIWLNTFFSNAVNARATNVYANHWNSTAPVTYTIGTASFTGYAGNRWDDNSEPDANDDGIGETPYIIAGSEDNVDYCPAYMPGILYPSFTYHVVSWSDPYTVQFVDTSAGYRDTTTWDFGDGDVDAGLSPVHTYADPGTYNVRMTASNDTIGFDAYRDVTMPLVAPDLSTTYTIYGPLGSAGWYTGDVTIELAATGGTSAPITTHYSFDNVSWQDYAAPIPITADGVTKVFYYSTDTDGLVEPVKLAYVKIEKTGLSGVWTDTNTIQGYGSANIHYTLENAIAHHVYIVVYDGSDNPIRTLDQGLRDSGDFSAAWDGKNEQGAVVSDGNYSIRVCVCLDNGTNLALDPLKNWLLFNYPQGIAVDSSGNVYLADLNNDDIKVIYSNGTIAHVGGGFRQPDGIAVDESGGIYVADGGNIVVKKIGADGNIETKPYYGAYPYALAIDPAHNIYVSNYTGITEIYANDTFVTRFTGSLGPRALAVDADGNIYFFNTITNFLEMLGQDDTITDLLHFDNDVWNDRVAVDTSGNLYVFDYADDTLTEYYRTDMSSRDIPLLHGGIMSISTDLSDNIYVTTDHNEIYEIYPDNTYVRLADRLGQPSGAAFDANDDLYVSNTLSSGIDKIHADRSPTEHPGSGISVAGGVAVDRAGNTYVTDASSGEVKKIDTLGVTTTLYSGLNHPCGIAVDGSGNTYVASSGDHVIVKIDGTGTRTQVGGYFDDPTGVAVDPLGNVYAVDHGSAAVREIYANGTTVDLHNELPDPWGIAIDDAGTLYVTGSDRITTLASDGTYGVIYRSIDGMQGIATDQSGTIGVTTADQAYEYVPDNPLYADLNISVDNYGPVTTTQFSGSTDQGGNYLGSATIDLSADDPGSGVSTIYYNIDQGYGGPWETYTCSSIIVSDLGPHTIYYYAVDNDGNSGYSSEDYFNIVDANALHASFTTDVVSGEAPLGVSFTSTSTGDITLEQWEFNDGTGGTQDHDPGHVFNDPGTYTVRLTVSDDNGNSDTNSTVIHVSPAGSSASFIYADGTDRYAIQFGDSCTGSVSGYDWDFGDGSGHDNGQNPSHAYPGPGTYRVTLIAYYSEGSSLYSADVTVNAPPGVYANFSVNNRYGQAPCDFHFTDTSSGSVVSRAWDFGDGQTSSDPEVDHTFSTPGDYPVTLIVSDGTDTDSSTITIHALSGPGQVTNLRTGYSSTSINDVIGQADTQDGDTIQIDSGTYCEHVDLNKRLTLVGNDNGGGIPVVDLNVFDGADGIQIFTDGVTLDSLEVTGCYAWGIYVGGNDCTISNCYVHDCNESVSSGIMVRGVNNTTITDFRADHALFGISLDTSQNVTVHNADLEHIAGEGIEGLGVNDTCMDGIYISDAEWGILQHPFYGNIGHGSYLNNITVVNTTNSAVTFTEFHDISMTGIRTHNVSADNIYSDVNIEICDNVTLRDYFGDHGNDGIWGLYCSNVSVYDSAILSHGSGYMLDLYGDRDWYIHNVTIEDALDGIHMEDSQGIDVDGASVNNSTRDGLYGLNMSNSNILGLSVTNATQHGIRLLDSYGMAVANSDATASGEGLNVENGINITLYNCTSYRNDQVDIHLQNVTDSLVDQCHAWECAHDGIDLDYSTNVTINGTESRGDYQDVIAVHYSHDNLITNSTFSDQNPAAHSGSGIYFHGSPNNTVTRSTFHNDTYTVFFFAGSTGNRLFLNDIDHAVTDLDGGNFMDSGTTLNYEYNGNSSLSGILGNHWGDYSGSDDNGDGIGDSTPYSIDSHPLIDTQSAYTLLDVSAAAASFNANTISGSAPLDVSFTDTSTGPISSWQWDFGDGSSSSDADPDHTYSNPGTYTVTLTVTDSDGNPGSNSTIIHVSPADSTANFDYAPGSDPLSIQFNDQSTGTVTGYDWDFGDGSAHSFDQDPYYVYASPGTYHVTLITTYGEGSSLYSADVTVSSQSLSAGFSTNVTSGISPLTVSFTDTSMGGMITDRQWDFGDGSVNGTGSYVEHTYTDLGLYTVVFTVTNGTGSNTITHRIYVAPPSGQVHNVDTGETFGSIQDAIDAADTVDGNTILVDSGGYRESVNVSKQLILMGHDTGSGLPIVYGTGNSGAAIYVYAPGVTVQGFNVTFATEGIIVDSNNSAVIGNVFHDNGWGIYVNLGGSYAVSGDNISGNTAYNNSYQGIIVEGSDNILVSGNTVHDNVDMGIYIFCSTNTNVTGNIVNNGRRDGISLMGSNNNVTVFGNNVTNNANDGISLIGQKSYDNRVLGNTITDNKRNGVFVLWSSNNTLSGNELDNNSGHGVYFQSPATGNTITWNNVSNSGDTNIAFDAGDTGNNLVYGNRFINVTGVSQAYNNNNTNLWSSNVPVDYTYNSHILNGYIGNYWSNYTGVDNDHNGIGDTPYTIDDNNVDMYPVFLGTATHINPIIVDPTPGVGLFTSITPAVAYALPGDTIIVHSGTYAENVLLDRAVTLTGEDTGDGMPFIDGSGGNTGINITADGVTIHGLNVTAIRDGIRVQANDCVIADNAISNGTSAAGTLGNYTGWFGLYGISILYSNNTTLSHNLISYEDEAIDVYSSGNITVTGNILDFNLGDGITVSSVNNSAITDNVVSNVKYSGIYVTMDNCTLINNTVFNAGKYGLRLVLANFNNISENNASFNLDGIYLDTSYNNTIVGNTINNNTDSGIYLGTTNVLHPEMASRDNIISENVANDNRYGINLQNSNSNILALNTISNDHWDGITIMSSCNNTLAGNVIDTCGRDGIALWGVSSDIVLDDNTLAHNGMGISLDSTCSNITVMGNSAEYNGYGLYIADSANDTISNNTVNFNELFGLYCYNLTGSDIRENAADNNLLSGIYLDSRSDGNNITGNSAVNNTNDGFYIYSSVGNHVSDNSFTNNGNGIHIDSASGNVFWLNVVSDNGINASIEGSPASNTWDSPESLDYTDYNGLHHDGYVGNYWGNYTGPDANADGIGDTSYKIDYDNIDQYPLLLAAPLYTAPLQAVFTESAVSGDSPLTVQFNDISSGDNVPDSWAWVINNVDLGTTAYNGNEQNISFAFLAPGHYSVTLTVNNVSSGESSTSAAHDIYVTSNFAASFTLSPASGYTPLTVEFNDTSTGNNAPDAWNWVIDNIDLGSTAYTGNMQNFTFTFLVPGNYAARLTAYNTTTGESATSTPRNITVNTVYYSNFTATPLSGSSPLTVQFNDTSADTNMPDAWAWAIANDDLGTTVYNGNSQNFSFTLLVPGNYSAWLTAYNSSSGESAISAPQNITVSSNFAAGFTATPSSGVSPLTVQFNDTTAGNNAPDAWSWAIDDGSYNVIATNSSRNFSYTFTVPDNYSIMLTALNSSTTEHATFSSYVNVTALPQLSAAFSAVPETGIVPLTVQFSDASIGDIVSYDWNFGDGPMNDTGKSPSHTYTTIGTYTAVLTVKNGTGATSITSRQIDVLSKPPYAYIPNSGDNTVSVIDMTNNTVIATFPAGASSQGVAVSADGKTAYITNNYDGTVSVIDTATNTVTATIAVESQPFSIALSPDGTKAYVANAGTGTVSVIDTATNTVTATIPTSGQYIQGIAVSPNGKKLYITSLFKKYVTVIDTATNTVTGTIGVGSYQVGVAFTPDGTKAYVATSGNITVIDAVNDKKIDSINNVNYPVWIAMSPDGTKAYVTGDKVYAIDTINDTIAATVPVGDNSQGVAVSPNGSRVYVVDSGNYLDYQGHVYVIDAGDDTVVTEITVGNSSYAWGPFISAPALPALAIMESTDTVTRGIPSSVSYHVTDIGGLPVDGATVTLTGNATEAGVTDSSGNVVIIVNATAPGRIRSTARLSGHAITTISMTANESISASFTANVTSGQAPLDVFFNGSATGYPDADTWNYSITNSTGTLYVNGQNFTYTFLYPDSYEVSLNASNTSIGVYSISPSSNIVVSAGMAAGFSINRTFGLAPLTVQFNDTSSGSPGADSWNYTVTNSTTTFYVTGQDNFTYTFLYPDTYTVSLNASNSSFGTFSTTSAQSIIVSLPGAPAADFTMNASAGEAPLTVTFTDASSGSPVSWFWDFGDGNSDSGSTIAHMYAVPGSYNATLTIQDAYMQSSTVGHIVAVWAPLQAHIAANVTGGVAPLNVSFNDTSEGYPDSWSWTINNSSVPLVYSDASQNFTYTFEYPDTYNVTLLVSNGTRTSTAIVQVVVTAASLPPVANFISNVTVGVSPLTVEFNDTSGGLVMGWDWNFGDGTGNDTAQNVTRTFNDNGPYDQTFTVTLTVSGPDGSSTRQIVNYITVIPPTPVANFTANATVGGAPLTVQFNDSSDSPSSAWLWDFGDGSNSSIRNVTHTYLSPGIYDVSLNLSNDGGYDNKTVPGYISVTSPVTLSAGFTASPTAGTAPLTVLFNDTTAGYPEADGWNYTITNSTTTFYGTSQNFTYTFLYPDTYTVILNASNSSTGQFSISGTTNIAVTSPAGPVANFTYSPHSGESPLTVSFTDASSGSPTSWDWDFGDGNTSSGPVATHTYAAAGSYTTTLTVHDAYSQSDSAGHNVDVWTPLAAYFTTNVSAGTAPMDVQFNDTSAGYPASWLWSINNSSTPMIDSGTGQNLTFTFAYPDTYNVTLQVTNGTRTSTILAQILVSAAAVPPSADFTSNVTIGVSPLDVQFNDTSGGIVTGYDWNFGDGSGNDSARNGSRTFYNAGPSNRTFTITLTVSGPDGSSTKQVLDYITVAPQPPVANFTSNVTGGFTPLTVQFNDTSSGAIGSWLWDFGDGNSSVLQNDTHTYAAPGLYPVSLTVSNAGGSDVMSKTGYISVSSPSLAAGFTVNQTIIPVGSSLSFTDMTTGSLIADRWNYTISNSTGIEYVDVPGQADFIYEFDYPDSYQVSLNASNSSNGIYSISASQSIYVYTPLAAGFSMDRSSGEAPLSVQFNDTSSGYPDADSWNYTITNSTDTFHVNGRNFTYTFIYPDTYTVSLNASNSSIGGFSISGVQSVAVTTPAAQVVDFTATPSSGEAPLAVTLAGTSTGVPVSWAWDFGDGNSGIGQTAYHTYNAAGTYTVVLTVTDAYSQTGTAGHTVDVWPGLVADFSSNVTGGVTPLDVQFNDTSAGYPDSWQWTIYDPASNPVYSDNSRNISYRFENGGTYTVMLQAGNGTRTDSISKLFTVDSPAALIAGFNANKAGGIVPFDVMFNDTSAGYPDSWAWVITDSASNTIYTDSSRNFTYAFTIPDTYTVSLTVTNGTRTNTASSQIVATVPVQLEARITANRTSGTGPLTVQFDDTSSGDIASREWNLSDTVGNITAQSFIHTFDTPGTYTVILTVYNATASSTDGVQIQVLQPDIIPLQAAIAVNSTAGPVPLTIQFNDSSTGYPDTFEWSVGDGSANSSARNITYTYYSAGTFTAMLTVANGSQTSTASVVILASTPVVPAADFRANLTKGIAPAAVQFYDLSTGSPESWAWDFGDGNTSGDENPVHIYATPGLYSVSLTAENTNGSNTSVRTGYINITKSLLENGEYRAALSPGWNLVSFPIDNYPLEASALTGTGVQDVAIFNTTTGRYDIYMMNQSGPENDIPISPGVGYFIYCDGPTDLGIQGEDPSGNGVMLHTGWNLVGWDSQDTSDAQTVCTQLTGSQQIVRYDSGAGFFEGYVEGLSPDSYDFAIQPGAGYFIYTDTPQTLDFGGL